MQILTASCRGRAPSSRYGVYSQLDRRFWLVTESTSVTPFGPLEWELCGGHRDSNAEPVTLLAGLPAG
jgi:hypothetical protein